MKLCYFVKGSVKNACEMEGEFMKSIIETSLYLVLAAFICYIGIDFVSMNMRVSKINETAQYLSDYVEICGNSVKTQDEEYALDEETLSMIEENAKKNNMKITCDYVNSTENYAYYNINIEYVLTASVIGMTKTHSYKSMTRVPIEEAG